MSDDDVEAFDLNNQANLSFLTDIVPNVETDVVVQLNIIFDIQL